MGIRDRLFAMLGPPAIVVVTAGLLHVLPTDVLNLLTAWTLLSFPIGIIIGHLALSED